MLNKPKDWDEVKESEVVESEGLPVGIYPVRILKVKDISEKEYLEIQFDIVKDTKYTGYFKKLTERLQETKKDLEWANQGIYRASYKETATKFFKAFITAVQKSNKGYVWDWNPQSLVGKFFVANYGEEEYEYEGNIKIAVKMREPRSIEAWQKGEIETPKLKQLKAKPNPIADPFVNLKVEINEDDLPF